MNIIYSCSKSGVDEGALASELTKLLTKETTWFEGSNQVFAAIFWNSDREALDINNIPMDDIRISGRSPILAAKLAKIG